MEGSSGVGVSREGGQGGDRGLAGELETGADREAERMALAAALEEVAAMFTGEEDGQGVAAPDWAVRFGLEKRNRKRAEFELQKVFVFLNCCVDE